MKEAAITSFHQLILEDDGDDDDGGGGGGGGQVNIATTTLKDVQSWQLRIVCNLTRPRGYSP